MWLVVGGWSSVEDDAIRRGPRVMRSVRTARRSQFERLGGLGA